MVARAKKDFLFRSKMCFLCYGKGHVAKDCRRKIVREGGAAGSVHKGKGKWQGGTGYTAGYANCKGCAALAEEGARESTKGAQKLPEDDFSA